MDVSWMCMFVFELLLTQIQTVMGILDKYGDGLTTITATTTFTSTTQHNGFLSSRPITTKQPALNLNSDLSEPRKRPNCSDLDALVCYDVTKKMSGYKASIQSCPTVRKVHLQLTTRGHFKKARHTSPNLKTRGDRKSLTINKPRVMQDVWFSSPGGRVDEGTRPGLRLRYKAQTQWNNGTAWRTGTGSDMELNDMKGCGTSQTCIRFGTKNCRHLECEYLLTYKIVNRTVLHLEISGRTNGWVALGLSSDDRMGGDDVIMCQKRTTQATDIVAVSMVTKVAHAKPQPHPHSDLRLTNTRHTDNFIYCKITRGVSATDSKVDLTNNWFQFYARGDIDRNGNILKHSQIPPVSLETMTMLRHFTVNQVTYDQLSGSSPVYQHAHPLHVMATALSVLFIVVFKVT